MAPRKPAHLRTLEFREAADFLQKLNREIARVRDVKETTDVIDHATNAAMTAWYLTDWVWHDIEEDRTAAPFRLLANTQVSQFDHYMVFRHSYARRAWMFCIAKASQSPANISAQVVGNSHLLCNSAQRKRTTLEKLPH